MYDFIWFMCVTVGCCVATAWWTARNMRYNQSALTQAVELMGTVALTMNQHSEALLDFQRQMLVSMMSKRRAIPTTSTPVMWTQPPAHKSRGNGQAEAPIPNVPAGRIEN